MFQDHDNGCIVGFVADLMFQIKIEEAAGRTGYSVEWIERVDQLNPVSKSSSADDALFTEPQSALVDRLSRLQPALAIFDLGNTLIPWRKWIPWIKSSPATRRIPLIGYGAHVAGEDLKAARSAGADLVVARSKFSSDLDDLILRYARKSDPLAIINGCEQELSGAARRGLELFNLGEYFEAHELLEEAWNRDQTAGRELYRAILQVAVAYLQIERGNFQGAVKMFWRLRQWIDPLPAVCRGVNVGQLRDDASKVYESLVTGGPERIADFDRGMFRPVIFSPAAETSEADD